MSCHLYIWQMMSSSKRCCRTGQTSTWTYDIIRYFELRRRSFYLHSMSNEQRYSNMKWTNFEQWQSVVQEIFDMFLSQCRSSYKCGASVTIDEQLITFHGRCHFQMFMPSKNLSLDKSMIPAKNRLGIMQKIKSKPVKWGLKTFLTCESTTGYILNVFIFV